MTDTDKLNFLLDLLKTSAELKHVYDVDDGSCWPYDPSSNGSYDDAFTDGEQYGHVELARACLASLEQFVNKGK